MGSEGLDDLPPLDDPTMGAFYARLAAANARSALMTREEYIVYTRSREVGFTGHRGSTAKAFSALFPAPGLARAALDALGFVAWAIVGDVVEAAAAFEAAASGVPVRFDVLRTTAIPFSAYAAAIAITPDLPSELATGLACAMATRDARGRTEALKAAREALDAGKDADRARATALAAACASGDGDVEGDEFLLSGMNDGIAAAAAREGVK